MTKETNTVTDLSKKWSIHLTIIVTISLVYLFSVIIITVKCISKYFQIIDSESLGQCIFSLPAFLSSCLWQWSQGTFWSWGNFSY